MIVLVVLPTFFLLIVMAIYTVAHLYGWFIFQAGDGNGL